jgi:trk system potassium uptake protein TrkA
LNIVIIGGGKVGYYLVKTLTESGKHSITLLEKDTDRCSAIAEELDCLVIRADGTDINALAQAGTENADVLVAVSGQDQDNLVACQIAKTKYGIKKTIARVNNPKNHEVFKLLGVDGTVSSTGIIAQLIEGELSSGDIQTLFTFEGGELELVEAIIDDSWRKAGQAISSLEIPKDCIIVTIYRGGKVIIPTGSTVIKGGDKVVALTVSKKKKSLNSFFA